MSFTKRARNFWACVSICFNQAVHFGAAPYPLSFSETCYLRRRQLRYRVGLYVVDAFFRVFGEYDHCEKSWWNGCTERARFTDVNRAHWL